MSVTETQQNPDVFTETYRGYIIELRQAGGQWYAKTTTPVQWVTPGFRSSIGAVFALHDLIDRYERAQEFCRWNRIRPRLAVGAVDFVAVWPAAVVDVGAAADEPSVTWGARS